MISGIKGSVSVWTHDYESTIRADELGTAVRIGRSPNHKIPMTLKFKSEVSSFPTKHSNDPKVSDTNLGTSDTKDSNMDGKSRPHEVRFFLASYPISVVYSNLSSIRCCTIKACGYSWPVFMPAALE